MYDLTGLGNSFKVVRIEDVLEKARLLQKVNGLIQHTITQPIFDTKLISTF